MGTWSLSPVRVVLRRETSFAVPRVEISRRGGSGRRKRRSKSRRKEKKDSEVEGEETQQVHRQASRVTLGWGVEGRDDHILAPGNCTD